MNINECVLRETVGSAKYYNELHNDGRLAMRLHMLSIKNFRGIRDCTICFTNGSSVSCLIGPGDSGKSTILTAIEWAFWPRYALGVGDIDFYNCDTTQEITIEATFSGYPDELIQESKFALYQRRVPTNEAGFAIGDDPIDDGPTALTIRLQIDDALEPEWTIVKNSQRPRRISAGDRGRIPVCVIDSRHSNDMLWGRQSLLQRYASSKEAVKATSINAARELSHMQLSDLDEVTKPVPEQIAPFGVQVSKDSLANRFIMAGVNMPSQVGLFDGNAPLMYLGEGSRRLFSSGLALNMAAEGSLLLLDEIESGLEPHRLCNLIALLRNGAGKGRASGPASVSDSQSIFTTHSPIVLEDLCHDELYAVNKRADGTVSATNIASEDPTINQEIQAQLRATPSSFLARRIIVCEGKTELGIMKALDNYHRDREGIGITAEGIALTDAGGDTKMFSYSEHLKEAGYRPCIFMDSDVTKHQGRKDEARENGIPVFDWDAGNMTEVQVLTDVTIDAVKAILRLAIDLKGEQSIEDQMKARGLDLCGILDDKTISAETRKELGLLAHKSKWFKQVDSGKALGTIILDYKSEAKNSSTLYTVLRSLEEWAIEQS